LLRRIQNDLKLGYKICHHEITDLKTNTTKREEVRQAVVAFADDTTWLAKSKSEMEQLIQISQ